MARAYAGVLGLLASAVILWRGWLVGGGLEGTLLAAMGSLFGFAILGYVAGRIAEHLVDDSVRHRFQTALQANESPAGPAAG